MNTFQQLCCNSCKWCVA